jgi:acetyl-CoA C-acetyltransferase
MLTKQACALWSCQPNPDGFRFADVSEETRARAEVRDVVADYCGEAVVAGFTVLYQGDTPWRAVAVLDIPDGRRTVAYSEQPGLLAQMMAREYCGEAVTVQAGQFSAVSSSGC